MAFPSDDDVFYDFSFLDRPCTSSSEESRSIGDKSDYVLCDLQAVESESDENVIPSLRRSETPGHDDRLVNLEKNVCESARVLAVCARELRKLEEIKQEKERLTVQLTELNAHNDTLRSRARDLERQCASDEVEKDKVLKLYDETSAELAALKHSYEEMKIQADTFEEKFLYMKNACDELQEKKTEMTEKIKEYSQIIKEKSTELEQAVEARNNAILAQRKTEEEIIFYKTEKLHAKEVSHKCSSVGNVAECLGEFSNLRKEIFLTVPNQNDDKNIVMSDSSATLSSQISDGPKCILPSVKNLSEQRIEKLPETPFSDLTSITSLQESTSNQATADELESKPLIILNENKGQIIAKDHKDRKDSTKLENLVSKPTVKLVEMLRKTEEEIEQRKLPETPHTKFRSSTSKITNVKVDKSVAQENIPYVNTESEKVKSSAQMEKVGAGSEKSAGIIQQSGVKKIQSQKRKVPCLRNLSFMKRAVKPVKKKEPSQREIQAMLDVFKRIFDEIQPLLEPLPSSFRASRTEEESPSQMVCIAKENVSTNMLDHKIIAEAAIDAQPIIKKETSRSVKLNSILRDAAQPVTRKILENKLSPESLLTNILDSKMDFQSILKRFSEEELLSIRTLSREDFGKIMAEAAIHLQTGDMWLSVLNKFRTRHSNAIINRMEENLIEVSSKLCNENANVWFPFIKRLWLILVSQSNHNISFCCRLTRYICLAVTMEVQLQQHGNSILYSNVSQFFHSLLTSIAFQYPQFLGQIIIFTISKTCFEYMRFLDSEQGENICKILATNIDINTRDVLQWFWQYSYGEMPLYLLKYLDPSVAKVGTDDMQKYIEEPLDFTETGYLKLNEDLARWMKMRVLTVLTPDGQTSLLQDFEAFEKLLHNACRSYAPQAIEVDSVIGNLFSTTSALGEMNVREARSLVIRLYFLIYFLPILAQSSLTAAKTIFIGKFEAAIEKCYTIRENLTYSNNVSNEARIILLDAFSRLLKLAPRNPNLQ